MPTEGDGVDRRWRVAGMLTIVAAAILVVHTTANRLALESGRRVAFADNPRLDVSLLMNEIGQAGARGQRPDDALVARLIDVSKRAPLLAEPLLVGAVAADQVGDRAKAERLLLAARQRNPRLPAVRYFLSDRYRRDGREAQALAELAVLLKVQPQRQMTLLPYFSRLAADPRNKRAVQEMIAANPDFGRQLLSAVAGENAPPSLVLELSSILPPHPDDHVWQTSLIDAAIRRGDYTNARKIWRVVTGNDRSSTILYDPEFDDRKAPAPFNWTFAAGPDGVAEPQGKGRLSLLYFGRNPIQMANQVLTLPEGRFRLRWKANGPSEDTNELGWQLMCLPSGETLGEAPLGARVWHFSIGSGCKAQRLVLHAVPGDIPRKHNVDLSGLRLEQLP